MNRFIRTMVFIVLGIFLLRATEDILKRKWNYWGTDEDFSRTFNQFYDLEKDSLQVVFLGKSTVKWGASPILIYNNSNIVSYNLATNEQPILVSYYLLGEVLEKQTPEIVFCDISALFKNEDKNMAWHIAMDNMPISMNKLKAAIDYTKLSEEGHQYWEECFLSIICPLYYYHDRWDELTKGDFLPPACPKYDYAAGYYMTSIVSGTNLTLENVNAEISNMKIMEGYKKEYSDGIFKEYVMDEELYHVNQDQTAVKYICKMKKLCEDHGAKLVMVKIPTIYMPQNYYASWSYDKYNIAKEFCETIGVSFLDMVYDKEYFADIDWSRDTIDGGMHLNMRGAEKVTESIVEYLEEMNLEKKTSNQYWEFSKDYDRVKKICTLQNKCNFEEYIDYLLQGENYTIVVSAQNDFQTSLSEENIQTLSQMGFQNCFTNGVRDSFIGIIDQKRVVYEALSNRKIEYTVSLPGGGKIVVASSGFNTGSYSSITIDGKEYSPNRTGLNIVVFDNETQLVVDSVNFNTQIPGAGVYRNSDVIRGYLALYRQKVIEENE